MRTLAVGEVSAIFNSCFVSSHATRLEGGAPEPVYVPAAGTGSLAVVRFRLDFVSSALHEAAHWCLAGARRRRLVDYGYWYLAEGRDPSAQRAFEEVESRPQALESLLSEAAGVPFRLSADNPGTVTDLTRFGERVAASRRKFRSVGLPPRAERFTRALAAASARAAAAQSESPPEAINATGA